MPSVYQKPTLNLDLIVRDRSGILFEGKVGAVSSFNDKGPFDILPLHTNFISLIRESVAIHLRGEVVERLSLKTGVLAVRENKVEVYIGILH